MKYSDIKCLTKILWSVSLVVCLSVGLFTVGYAAEEDVKVFQYMMTQECKTLDPHDTGDFGGFYYRANPFDGLTRYQGYDPGKLEPWLATSWKSEQDGKEWTFYLRRGVLFHDGSEMTSEDVVYSMEKILWGGKGYASTIAAVLEPGKTEAIDEYTVQFHLSKAYMPWPSLMQFLFVVNKGVLERHQKDGDYGNEWLAQNGSKLGVDGVGTGAYTIEEWVPSNYMIFEKNPNFWKGWDQPHMKKIRATLVRETATRLLGLKQGQFHYTSQTITYDNMQDLMESPLLKDMDFPFPCLSYINLNTTIPPTSDVHFRRALNYLLDYDAFTNDLMHGYITRTMGGYIPGSILGSLDLDEEWHYTYDPEKADAELALCEIDYTQYKLEFGIEMPYPEHIMLAEMLISELAKRGVDASMSQVSWPTWLGRVSNPETSYHIAPMGLSPYYLDPDHWSRVADPRGFGTHMNASWYSNEEVTALHEEANATPDPEKRAELYRKAQRIELQDASHIWVGEFRNKNVINVDVGGVENYSLYGTLQEFRDLYFISEWE